MTGSYSTRRTVEDVGLHRLRRRNPIRAAPLAEDRVCAPFTAVVSVAFLIPEGDTHSLVDQPAAVGVRYPQPVRGWSEKRIFAPRRVSGGILVRALWWRWLKTISYERARRGVAHLMDDLYPLSLDPLRPLVAVRAALVDWDIGFAVEPRRLRDPWYSERTFSNIKLDTWNLKSWGMAAGAPIQTADRKTVRTGARDTVAVRRWRRDPGGGGGSRDAQNPMAEHLRLDPATLVRAVLDQFLTEAEAALPALVAEAKKMPAALARLRAQQTLAILRTTYFERQARERLFSIYLEGYNDPEKNEGGATAQVRRRLRSELLGWCWAETRRRFL